jgi:predicted nucleic acid-binding protein
VDKVLVVNASPLIFLARIERLDLLASLAKLLVVPEAVIREIQAGSNRDGAADRVHDLVSGSEVVLDDLAARRCARSLDLPMIGTLGVVLLCPPSRRHQCGTAYYPGTLQCRAPPEAGLGRRSLGES